MSTEAEQVLARRLGQLRPEADDPDWRGVTRRARRWGYEGSPPSWRRPGLLVAGLVAGLALTGGAVAVTGTDTGIPAIDRLLDTASQVQRSSTIPEPAPSNVHVVAGSLSERLSFRQDGIEYVAVGFRSRQGSICTATTTANDSESAPAGVSCLSEKLLRKALQRKPFHLFAGGGVAGFAVGFAEGAVERIQFLGAEGSTDGIMSEPWRPTPWKGEPIRFIYAPASHSGAQVEFTDGRVLEMRD